MIELRAGALIFGSTITQGPIPVLQGAIGAKKLRDSAIVTIVTSAVATILFMGIVAALPALQFSSLSGTSPLVVALMAVAGVLYAVANLLIFLSVAAIGSTHFGVVFTLRVAPIALLSQPLLGENLTGLKLVGIVTIIAGVSYAWIIRGRILAKEEVGKAKVAKQSKSQQKASHQIWWWVTAGIGTLAFGSANALDARIVQEVDTATYLPIRLMLPVLIIGVGMCGWAVLPQRFKLRYKVSLVKRCPVSLRQRWLSLLLLSVFMPVSASTFMWAVQITGQPTLLGSFHQTSLFATIAIGAWLKGGVRAVVVELARYWLPAAVCCIGVALALGLTPGMFLG